MSDLRGKMLKEMELRNFTKRTQETYLSTVYGLSKYYMKSPDQISSEEINDYIYYLLKEKELSWSSCNIAISGIRFFLFIP